jgi:chromosome segregation ATPase
VCFAILPAELAARTSQLDIATGEVDSLRRQVMDLQLHSERSASQLAKLANEVDLTRSSAQRLAGQLEDSERRRRELDAELSRLRGNREYDVAERRRTEAEVSRDQEKHHAILSELESLKVS